MRVAIVTRCTLYSSPGGDTVQAVETARHLVQLGVKAEVRLSNEHINYNDYDLLHFFNLIRPADILRHSSASKKPYVISTILVDYSEYDKQHRGGFASVLMRNLSADGVEYIKTLARVAAGKDQLASYNYLWLGQRNSIRKAMRGAAMLLPNSPSEYQRLTLRYGNGVQHQVVPNGIDTDLFDRHNTDKNENLVLCVARIEGIKNQLNLIKALNNTRFKLLLIGRPAANQPNYYQACRDAAASNITFIDHLPQIKLIELYRQAKVHVLPSWFETTGLSSLEAAAMGCNIVITDKGDTRNYFDDLAYYCTPTNPASIYKAVNNAANAPYNDSLRQKILNNYTWGIAARQTLSAYQQILPQAYET